VGENICQLHIRQRTDNRELKNSPKINEPIKKWATELNRTSSKDKIQMAKKHVKNIISGHKGNANQNHTKIPPYPC
jgi:16S rRNA G527 N7-methylase RsmG